MEITTNNSVVNGLNFLHQYCIFSETRLWYHRFGLHSIVYKFAIKYHYFCLCQADLTISY